IPAELVDEVSAEERGQRGHAAAAARRARAPGRGQGEAADARRLLGLPVAVEPEGEGVDVARLPIEPEQAERVVRGAVAREAGNRHGGAGGTGQGDEARRGI